MHTQDVGILEGLTQDSIWFNENYEEFQKYQGKVIAIKEKQILAIEDSVEQLLKRLEKIKEDPAILLIEAIPPRNVAFIL